MDSEPRAAERRPPARPAHPARGHGRVLRVGRAARRSGPAGPSGRGRRPARGARRRGCRQLRGACLRRAIRDPHGAGGRLCPTLVIVRPDFARYKRASDQVFELFREVTPLVEPMSLDEAYLDVTENAWHEPLGMRVARRLKDAIRERTQLTASAGVAPNKFLAKIASGWQKPDGLTVIAPERVETSCTGSTWTRCGASVRSRRASCGHAASRSWWTCARADIERLRGAVGSLAEWLRQLAHGVDPRPVVATHERKSAGSEPPSPRT